MIILTMIRMVVLEEISTTKMIHVLNGINYIIYKQAKILWGILFSLSILLKKNN